MARNYRCPNCNSEHIRRYQDIYNEGVVSHSSEHNFVGVSGDGIFTGVGNSQGISITDMAKTVAPPAKKTYRLGNVIIYFIAVIWLIAVIGHDIVVYGLGSYEIKSLVIAFTPLLIIVLLLVFSIRSCIRAYKWNRDSYPQVFENWRNSFICLRCGYRFYYDD